MMVLDDDADGHSCPHVCRGGAHQLLQSLLSLPLELRAPSVNVVDMPVGPTCHVSQALRIHFHGSFKALPSKRETCNMTVRAQNDSIVPALCQSRILRVLFL